MSWRTCRALANIYIYLRTEISETKLLTAPIRPNHISLTAASNGSLSKFSQQAYGLVFGFAQIDHAKRLASLLIFGASPNDHSRGGHGADERANWPLQMSTSLCFLVTVVVRLAVYANAIAWLLFCGHKQVITLGSRG